MAFWQDAIALIGGVHLLFVRVVDVRRQVDVYRFEISYYLFDVHLMANQKLRSVV